MDITFVLRRRSFTSRKLYVCIEAFLCFLHISDKAYVSRARCTGLFLLLFVLAPHDSNVAVYAQVYEVYAKSMMDFTFLVLKKALPERSCAKYNIPV